ncbi:MAG: hypothetical protein JWM37_550 [Candidatus Saccharibacteria bacterium]|nr:hypothetical protein [Candidatus Saccharibacteria bacterium]
MTILWLLLIIGSLLAATAAFLWVVFTLKGPSKGAVADAKPQGIDEQAEENAKHIFNDEFREELRNRGRLHFEKIIGENAMFLQQDLRLTTSQLNEYMKTEITRKLQDEFTKYEESIMDAKQLAIDSIQKTNEAVDQQREMMSKQLQKEVSDAKEHLMKRFEDNTADVVNHYILAAIGNQIDLTDQLEYIIGELEANKEAIREDIANGA